MRYQKSSRLRGSSRYARKKSARTSRPRRYSAKKRTYRKKTSKKRMINMLSRKKRDTMLSAAFSGSNPSPESPVTPGTPLQMTANSPTNGRVHMTFTNVSHRYLVPNNSAYTAYRTATNTYVKGFSQTYTIIPNNESAWWHRRIMFATKEIYSTVEIQQSIGVQPFLGSTTNLPMRDLGNITEGPYNDLRNNILGELFAGTPGVDWISPFRAKTDRTRISVISDRSFNYSSANDTAKPRIIKTYDAINKSVVYSDVENGLSMNPSPLSVDSKRGIGNIYVVDFYFCPSPEDDGVDLTVSSQSTYYWHEK